MRKRPNLKPRMERCGEVLIPDPAAVKGRWKAEFPGYDELRLEIGCGKGGFTAALAASEPEMLLLALEKSPDAMIKGMELVCSEGIGNVRFMDADALLLRDIFAPGEIGVIYINFCDPWPKSRDAKHRLTAPGFLRSYADILPLGGEIRFKTDNRPLFDWSLDALRSEGWEIKGLTNDLHKNGVCGIMTDYERKFHGIGIPINALTAVKTQATKCGSDGVPERLRNAALSDARGAGL